MTYSDLIHRRHFFQKAGLGIGALALGSLLREASAESVNPLAPKQPLFAPKAKRVIYLHMIGAPSQLDLFDHKPALVKHDGEACPPEFLKGKRFAFLGGPMKLAGTEFKLARSTVESSLNNGTVVRCLFPIDCQAEDQNAG